MGGTEWPRQAELPPATGHGHREAACLGHGRWPWEEGLGSGKVLSAPRTVLTGAFCSLVSARDV